MKSLKLAATLLSLLTLGWFSTGCHAQVPPTTFQVNLTWTSPAASGSWTGCTSASPCTYVASRYTLVTADNGKCPAVNLTTPNYTPLNQASPVSATAYSDTTAAGLTACYVVQTEQASAVSTPSNVAGPFVVPASPLAPSLSGNQTVAKAVMPEPTVSGGAPVLTAKLAPAR